MSQARRVCILVFIAVAESTSAADAQTQPAPPFEIKGVALGMTRDAIRSTYPEWNCRERACGGKGTPTSGFSTLATVSVEFVSVFFNDDDKIVRLNVTLPISGAFPVGAALKEKYGAPAISESPFQTRGGAKVTQFTHIWQRNGQTLRLVSPQSRIDQSHLTLVDDAHLQGQVQKLKSEAVKDL